MTHRTMLFHTPYPLDPTARSASGLRPVRMRRAFEEIGYRVLDVSGSGKERVRAASRLRSYVRAGGSIDFVYSESSTMPTLMTQPHHIPTHPLVDFSLLSFLSRRDIPVGLFYRDIYWAFPEYRQQIGRLVSTATSTLYRYDLARYRQILTRLYLPSEEMGAYVPIVPQRILGALPPGADIVPRAHKASAGTLRLFYVGGLSGHYRLHECVSAVAATRGVRMVLCTRQSEWAAEQANYEPLRGDSLEVVHESGETLTSRYEEADVAVLFVEPQPYRDFAVPFKLFEYVGRGVPILATEGTLAGRMVAEQGLGWTVPYDSHACAELLAHLRDHPEEVNAMADAVVRRAEEHTWAARARSVAADLCGATFPVPEGLS